MLALTNSSAFILQSSGWLLLPSGLRESDLLEEHLCYVGLIVESTSHQSLSGIGERNVTPATILFGTWSAVAFGGRSVRVHGVASEGR